MIPKIIFMTVENDSNYKANTSKIMCKKNLTYLKLANLISLTKDMSNQQAKSSDYKNFRLVIEDVSTFY